MFHCPECTSQRLYKDGVRQTNSGDVQRYLCRECGHRFSENGNSKSFNMTSGKSSSCQICANPFAHGQVINLAAIEPLKEGPAGATTDLKPKLLEYSLWMKKEAYADATIIGRTKLLKVLTRRGANLYDPESIKTTISKQVWSEGRKANAVDAYSTFLKMTGGQWQPPRYQSISKIPFIPSETEIDQIISGCSNRMATFVQLLKETGMRCGEAWQLKWTDFDTETRTMRITPEKGSNPRIAKISPKLKSMLEALPKNYKERIFSNPNQPPRHPPRHIRPTKKTLSLQTQKPKTTQNNLPHPQTLERHNGIPPNKRHPPRQTSLRPQTHRKHLNLRSTRRGTLQRRNRSTSPR